MNGNSPRQQAYRLVMLQMIVAVAVSIVWLISGWIAAVSALLGGAAVVLPNLYFAYRLFAVTQARQVQRIISAFYWGELTKLCLSAILVVMFTHLWPSIEPLPFFSDFAVTAMGFWLAPLIMRY